MEVVFILIVAALTIIPLFKLLPSFGIHPFWAFAAIIPLGVVVLLWVMAARIDRKEAR